MNEPAPPEQRAAPTPRWPWAALALALLWVVAARVPLVLNARDHLDSDLAVDGLTLLDAVNGHWRWHYPGTPHIGIGPVLLSWPQAKLLGAGPATLASGGVVAYGMLVILTFLAARSAFGPRVAAWSLVPLAFASTGTIWLSGRITGGHLLAGAWHAGALLFLCELIRRGGAWRGMRLGVWCGLGLYLDQMFLLTVAAVVAAGMGMWLSGGASRGGLAAGLLFVLGFSAGYWPHVAGVRAEPHDAYQEQFQTIFGSPGTAIPPRPVDWSSVGQLATEHARLLSADCLPRMIAGHRLPGLQAEPHPDAMRGRVAPRRRSGLSAVAAAATGLSLVLFVASLGALARGPSDGAGAPSGAVRWVMVATCVATVGAFVVNRNIFNSDNYRYLVVFLVAWPVGFGLLMSRIAARGARGRAVAVGLSAALALAMTADTAAWYAGFGWTRGGVIPARVVRPDAALAWLGRHPEADAIFGGYWDVYRLSFLTGGRVKGVPYPVFPDRFPEVSAGMPAHRPRTLVARRTAEGNFYRRAALRDGATPLLQDRDLTIYDWPR